MSLRWGQDRSLTLDLLNAQVTHHGLALGLLFTATMLRITVVSPSSLWEPSSSRLGYDQQAAPRTPLQSAMGSGLAPRNILGLYYVTDI